MAERLTKPVQLWQLVAEGDSEDRAVCGDRVVQDPCDVAFLGPYSFVVADSEGHRLLLVDIARNVTSVIAERQVSSIAVNCNFAPPLFLPGGRLVAKYCGWRFDAVVSAVARRINELEPIQRWSAICRV